MKSCLNVKQYKAKIIKKEGSTSVNGSRKKHDGVRVSVKASLVCVGRTAAG